MTPNTIVDRAETGAGDKTPDVHALVTYRITHLPNASGLQIPID